TLLVPGELEEEVLRRAQLPPGTCLLLAATHTHSGPGGTWNELLPELSGNGRFDAPMRDAIAQAAADAIRTSIGDPRTRRIAAARASGERVARRALEAVARASSTAGAGLSCSVTLAALPPPQASARVPWPLRRAAGNFLSLAAEPFAVETEIGLGSLVLRGIP